MRSKQFQPLSDTKKMQQYPKNLYLLHNRSFPPRPPNIIFNIINIIIIRIILILP